MDHLVYLCYGLDPGYVGSLGYASREVEKKEGRAEILGFSKYKGAKVREQGKVGNQDEGRGETEIVAWRRKESKKRRAIEASLIESPRLRKHVEDKYT